MSAICIADRWFSSLGAVDLKSTGNGFIIPASAGWWLEVDFVKIVNTTSSDSEVLVPAVISVGTNSATFDNVVNSEIIDDPVINHGKRATLASEGRFDLTSGLKWVVEVAATGLTTLTARIWVSGVIHT